MTGRTIYDELDVEPIINAAGTFTCFGGSLMSPEVIAAWTAAAGHFVDLGELQDKVGERIAKMLKAEAALVTGGAAAAILLGTAAAITVRHRSFLECQESPDGAPWEVLRQADQRDPYDRQVATCGVRIVDVTSIDHAESQCNERTVMMMAYNVYEPASVIRHEEWIEFGRQHSIPTLLDAAADVPPVTNLMRFASMGYDMVAYSGGKAICGPQAAGLLIGRRDLIDLAKLNASPHEGVVGRVAKVSKEDIVAFWKALELYLQSGDNLHERCLERIDVLRRILFAVNSVSMHTITPAIANHFPHLLICWDEAVFGIDHADVRRRLMAGSPRIATGRVYATGEDGLLVSVVNLRSGEDAIVGERIKEILLTKSVR